MRKQSRLLLVMTILSATSLSASQEEETGRDMAEMTDFAARYAATWSSQDPVAFGAFYAENGIFRINDGESSIGRDAITETARGFMAAFPDMVGRLVELRRTNDRFEFHWRWTGTNTAPGGTGNTVDLTGYELWTLDSDGLILESYGNMDHEEYERRLNEGAASPEQGPSSNDTAGE